MLCAIAITLAAAQDKVFQLEAVPGTHQTVDVFPTGTVSGYPFTISRRPDNSLPVVRMNYLPNSSFRLYIKLANNKYGLHCDWQTADGSPRNGSGLLLPEGEYLYRTSSATSSFLMIGGRWVSEAVQSAYWDLKWGGQATQTINFAGGGTAEALAFTVTPRLDGSLPVVSQKTVGSNPFLIYKRLPTGDYATFCKYARSDGPGVLLTAGDYAVPASAPPPLSPGDYTVLYTGEWRLP